MLAVIFNDHLSCRETFKDAIELEVEEGDQTIEFEKVKEVWTNLDI
jgi:hypothetical protein